MPQVRFTDPARQDLLLILEWTEDQFGESARLRYEALIKQAIIDLGAASTLKGSMEREELGLGIRTYHLTCSRDHVALAVCRVKRPRHLIAYRHIGAELIELVRVLHDRMELKRSLFDPGGEKR